MLGSGGVFGISYGGLCGWVAMVLIVTHFGLAEGEIIENTGKYIENIFGRTTHPFVDS